MPEPSKEPHLRPASPPAPSPEVVAVTAQRDPHCLALEGLPNLPVVHWNELAAVPDLVAARTLYSERGRNFASDAALLDQLRADWKEWRGIEYSAALTKPLPKEYPVTTATVDGKERTLIGIYHILNGDLDVFAMQRTAMARYPFPLAEQNLGFGNMGIHSLGLEIPDQYVHGILYSVLSDEAARWGKLVRWLKDRLLPKEENPAVTEYKQRQPETELGKRLATVPMLGIARNLIGGLLSRVALHMPVDLMVHDLPTNIRLELLEQSGEKLPYVVARSAYMAEFLRTYDSERAIRTGGFATDLPPDLNVKSVAFICGAGHVSEICYFWEKGVRNERIAEKARHDAELLSSDPIAFHAMMQLRVSHATYLSLALAGATPVVAVSGAYAVLSALF